MCTLAVWPEIGTTWCLSVSLCDSAGLVLDSAAVSGNRVQPMLLICSMTVGKYAEGFTLTFSDMSIFLTVH